jgi:predicted O-methyltransferase YrrM
VAVPVDKSQVLALPGWFSPLDFDLFDWFLSQQREPGDLLEIGTFKGQSAVPIGSHRRAGERFTVCDIFERSDYDGLTRREFETNYLRFHSTLPDVVDDSSLNIRDHVKPHSCRFIHIDGSHLYEFIKSDIEAALDLADPQAVIVLDDYRTMHTPGVAAAAWAAVIEGRLFPVCLSEVKLYATVRPTDLADGLAEWFESTDCLHGTQEVLGKKLVWAFPSPPSRLSTVTHLVSTAVKEKVYSSRDRLRAAAR